MKTPRLVDGRYAAGEEKRNSSRKNEEAEPKWKQGSVVDVSAGMKVKSDAMKNNIAWEPGMLGS